MMAECTQGSAFSPRSHQQPSHLESSPDIPELGCLAKENSSEACLGTDSTPSLSRKTKNIYTAGAATPAFLRVCQGSDGSADWGAPLKGPVFLSMARPGRPDRKHRGHPREAGEKALENRNCSGPGAGVRSTRLLLAPTLTTSAQVMLASLPPHLCTLANKLIPEKKLMERWVPGAPMLTALRNSLFTTLSLHSILLSLFLAAFPWGSLILSTAFPLPGTLDEALLTSRF